MLQALFSAQQDRPLRLYFGSANGIASSNLLMHTLFSLLVEKQIRVAVQKYNLSAVSSQQWATPLQAYLSLRHGTGLIIILAADVVEKALLKVVRKKGACIQDEREGKNKAPRRELIPKAESSAGARSPSTTCCKSELRPAHLTFHESSTSPFSLTLALGSLRRTASTSSIQRRQSLFRITLFDLPTISIPSLVRPSNASFSIKNSKPFT